MSGSADYACQPKAKVQSLKQNSSFRMMVENCMTPMKGKTLIKNKNSFLGTWSDCSMRTLYRAQQSIIVNSELDYADSFSHLRVC